MSSDPSEGWHSIVLATARVLPQRPIRPDVDVDDLEGVLEARAPHPEDQGPVAQEIIVRPEVAISGPGEHPPATNPPPNQ
jgi:hypothetical protein